MDKKDAKNIIYVNGKPVDPNKDGQDIFGRSGKRSKKRHTGRIVFTVVLVTICAIGICIAGIINTANRHASPIPDISLTPEDSEDMNAKSMAADGTTPDRPYTAPEELGENLSDSRIRLDGQIYQLPIPYSVLAEDGWTFSEPEYSSDDVVTAKTKIKSHDTSYECYIKKNDSPDISVQITNFSSKKALASDCAVTGISLHMAYEESQKPWISAASASANLNFSVSQDDFDQMMKVPEIKKLEIGQDIYIDTSTTDGITYKYINIYFPKHDGAGGEELSTSVGISFRNKELDSFTYSVNPYFSS